MGTFTLDPAGTTFHLPGDPGSIRASANGYLATGHAADQTSAQLRGARAPHWTGDEGDMYRAQVNLLPPILTDANLSCISGAQALRTFADVLEQAQTRMRQLQDGYETAASQYTHLSAALGNDQNAPASDGQSMYAASLQAMENLQEGAAAAVAQANAIRAQVHAAAAACGDALSSHISRSMPPNPVRASLTGPDSPHPGDHTPPAQVRLWWRSLSKAQQTRLIESDPQGYGGYAGIPTADRDRANRITLARVKADGQKWFRDAGIPIPSSPDDIDKLTPEQLNLLGARSTEFTADGMEIEVRNPEAEGRLEAYSSALALALSLKKLHMDDPSHFLLHYEPQAFNGRGRTILSVGDPETADNVATMVSGLTSRTSSIHKTTEDARNLATAKVDEHKTMAVVVWQGYDAPQLNETDVAFQDKADAGARLLASDMRDLRATRDGTGPLTIIAHSYGSTTASLALQRYGLSRSVDQVALIGSPGLGGDAHNARDLHLRHNQLFIGSASRDQVTKQYAGLGYNPAMDDVGGTRFKAENLAREYGLNPVPDHTRYYDATTQSESFHALADIASGHADALGEDGLIVQPRHLVIPPTPTDDAQPYVDDPEEFRDPASSPIVSHEES